MDLPAISYPLLSAVLTSVVYVAIEILLSAGFDKTALAATLSVIGGAALLLSTKPKILLASLQVLSKSLPALLLASFFGFAFSRLLEVTAIGMAGAPKIAVMAQLETFFVIVLAALFLKERPGMKKLFYGSFIVVGALLTNVHLGGASGPQFTIGTAEALGIIFPLGYAIAVVLLTDLNRRIEPKVVTGCAMILGSLMLFAFYGGRTFNYLADINSLSIAAVLLVCGILVGMYRLAYNVGLRLLGASITSIVYASTPLFTFLFSSIAVVFLPGRIPTQENPQFLVASAFLILAGTFLLARAQN